MGCVNDRVMEQFMDAPKECILFIGFSWITKYTWRYNLPAAEIEMKFLERNIRLPDPASPDNPGLFTLVGHNHFINPKDCKWHYLFREDGTKIYKEKDLNTLFNRQT
jgi:hypothetical protein